MPSLVCRTLYSLSSTSTLVVAFTLPHSIVKDSLFLSHYQQKRKGKLERRGQVQEEAGQAFGPIPDCPQSLPSSQDAVKFLPVSHQVTEGARIQSQVCPTPKTTLICPHPQPLPENLACSGAWLHFSAVSLPRGFFSWVCHPYTLRS